MLEIQSKSSSLRKDSQVNRVKEWVEYQEHQPIMITSDLDLIQMISLWALNKNLQKWKLKTKINQQLMRIKLF
jgi:hypothetical protein